MSLDYSQTSHQTWAADFQVEVLRSDCWVYRSHHVDDSSRYDVALEKGVGVENATEVGTENWAKCLEATKFQKTIGLLSAVFLSPDGQMALEVTHRCLPSHEHCRTDEVDFAQVSQVVGAIEEEASTCKVDSL